MPATPRSLRLTLPPNPSVISGHTVTRCLRIHPRVERITAIMGDRPIIVRSQLEQAPILAIRRGRILARLTPRHPVRLILTGQTQRTKRTINRLIHRRVRIDTRPRRQRWSRSHCRATRRRQQHQTNENHTPQEPILTSTTRVRTPATGQLPPTVANWRRVPGQPYCASQPSRHP